MTCNPIDQSVPLCGADAALYGQAALHLLPNGPAWPKEEGTALHKLYADVIGGVIAALAARACLILPELDPCTADLTRDRWVKIYGSDLCRVNPCLPAEEVLADLCLRARLAVSGEAPDIIAIAADLGFAAHWRACPPVWPLALTPLCELTAGSAGQNMAENLILTAGPPRIITPICEMVIGRPWCFRPGLAALRCIVEIYSPAHRLRGVLDEIV